MNTNIFVPKIGCFCGHLVVAIAALVAHAICHTQAMGDVAATEADDHAAVMNRLLGEEFVNLSDVSGDFSEDDLATLARSKVLRRLMTGPIQITNRGLAHIAKMTILRDLYLDRLGVKNPDLGLLSGLPNLECLFLRSAGGTDDTICEGIGRLKHLKLVSIFASDMKGVGLNHLARLPHLTELILESCEDLEGRNLARIAPLKLTTLGLFGAQVRSTDLLPLQLEKIAELNLGNTKIDDSHPEVFARMLKLERLDLSATRAGDKVVEALVGSRDLWNLYLTETAVTPRSLPMIGKMKSLDHLDLSGCKLSGKGMEHLKSLKELRSLDLGDTGLKDSGLESIAQIDSLELLFVADNAITTEGVFKLKRLKKLEKLFLGNVDSPDKFRSLFREMPSLKMVDVGGDWLKREALK